MKKYLIFITAILLAFLLVVSRHNTNNQSIENLAYVIAIGIDNGENNLLKLTLQIATSSSGSSQSGGGSSQTSNSTITSVECSSIMSGINLINSYISKKINLSHCKIVVFSEDFAVSGIADEVSTLVNNVEIRPDCSIAICKSSAEDFLEMNKPVLINLTARYYEVVVTSGDYTGFSRNITLSEFYNCLQDSSIEPTAILSGINFPATSSIPAYSNYVDIDSSYTADEVSISNKNNMQICGLAVFKDGALVGEMTAMDSICHLIVTGKLQNAIINIPDPYDMSEIINLSIVQVEKPDIQVELVNGAPYIYCDLELNSNIVSLSSDSDYATPEKLQTITDYANSYLETHITDYLYKTAKDFQSDVVGFGKYALPKFTTIQEWNEFNWRDNYVNSFFEANVDMTIVNSSLIQKN